MEIELGSRRKASRDFNVFQGTNINLDLIVKSLKTVMPDLIRHPEVLEFTGFRLSPE
jgi:hypothetical protein